jgi:murein DD-endopeptidase MepM/ murein hydrolase activator NlpD
MRLIRFFTLIFIISYSHASPLYASSDFSNAHPGGIYITEISIAEYNQDLLIDGQKILKWNKGNKFYVLYGLSYHLKTEQHNFEIKNKDGAVLREIGINIVQKNFKTQKIKVNKKYTKPTDEILKKIKKDRIKLVKARKIWFENNPDMEFILPVKGITTGIFGTKRFYNGIEGNYHNGFDIAADTGTPIVAPSSGKITLTGDFFYNGKSIILDHGRGLKSIMIHLDEILVEENQYVEKGQIIGKVGTTGKSTGAHLHWSVLVNNTYIDPELLIDKSAIGHLNLEGS